MTIHPKSPSGVAVPAAAASLASCAVALLVCLGCDDGRDQVRSYEVPRELPPPEPAPAEARAVAPGPMQWELPEGWARIENPNPMRFATLTAGHGDDMIEVAITRLGGAAGGTAANVNRWRGQIGLAPADEGELARLTEPVPAVGAQGVMVDLIGPAEGSPDGQGPRMFAAIFPTTTETWFIKAIGIDATLDGHREAFVELCRSVSFGASDAAPAAAAGPPPPTETPAGLDGGPTWSALPEGWVLDAQPSPMSVASFTVTGDGPPAALTITPLGGTQDTLSNVNRWRGQVGLGPLASLDEEPPVALEVAGLPGQLVDINGPERRTLAVISVRGDTTWFYKLSGPGPLVASQRPAFEAFVRSIRFGGSDA